MPAPVPVGGADDPRLSDYSGLREHWRRAPGDRFVVEGPLAVGRLLASRYPVRSVLVTERGGRDLEAELAGCPSPVYEVSQAVMGQLCGFNFHRGALASAERLPLPPALDLVAAADRVLVVEGVNDYENLGSLFRNAAAFGVGAVVLDPTTCDPLYRRVVRVSVGHSLHLPFARATVDEWPGVLAGLPLLGTEVLALTPSPEAEDVAAVATSTGRRWALCVGAEGPGLSVGVLAAAGRRVRVPMADGVDSLNVATAAAIALHRLASTG
ncbi:MAG: RNA methyltransferase [Actinomycetota bacterium]